MRPAGACSSRRSPSATGWLRRPASTLALLVAVAACGDDGTGPSGDVDFPALEAAVRAEFCIRGQMVPTDEENESLQPTDCPTVFPVGTGPDLVYETWRVRVASSTTVTIFTESNLDAFLDLFQIDPANPVLGLGNLLAFNDDGGTGLDASITFALQPGVEYWVMVSGFDPEDLGPYTLRVTD